MFSLFSLFLIFGFYGPVLVAVLVILILFLRGVSKPTKSISERRSTAHLSTQLSVQSRKNTLQIVHHETEIAFLGGNIRKDTYDDMEQYLAGQHARLANPYAPRRIVPEDSSTPTPVPIPLSAREAAAELPHLLARISDHNVPERKEDPAPSLAGVAPHAAPVQPANEPEHTPPPRPSSAKESPMLESSNRSPVPKKVVAAERSWAERFFTPENVRILQSLGIGIIFLSAVAFVRAEMWNGASGWSQLLMLAAGTACCSALGFLLLRFTSLRLTGLGFLILGQLSLLVDLYAARVFHAPSGQPIYAHSFASLWTLGFIAFTFTAYIQARWIKESLFNAFTYFGALAAWAAGMVWVGASLYVLPASFVPVLLISAFIARRISGSDAQPRWSLAWWLTSGVSLSAPVLCFALPLAALLSGHVALARDYHWHALAIFGLSVALLKDAFYNQSTRTAHVPAMLLLSIAPLGVYAFNGFDQSIELWPLSLTLPGLLLMSVATVLATRANAFRKLLLDHLSTWGLVGVLAGLILLIPAWGINGANVAYVITSLSIAAAGLLQGLLLREKLGPWLFLVASTFAISQVLQINAVSLDYFPLAGMLLAGSLYAFWTSVKIQAVSRHGQTTGDLLAVFTAGALFLCTPLNGVFSGSPLPLAVHAAWVLLAVYAMLSSLLSAKVFTRFCGTLLLAFAVVPPQLTLSTGALSNSPSLAIAAVIATLLTIFLHNREKNADLLKAGISGCVCIAVYGALLSLLELMQGRELSAAIGLVMQSLSLASLALILRDRLSLLKRACSTEVLALLQFAFGLAVFAHYIGVTGIQWPLATVMISALTLFAALALESLSGACLSKPETEGPFAFLESRVIAVGLLSALSLLLVFSGDALRLPRLDMTWRTLFGVSLLGLYFTFATSSRDLLLNRSIRWSSSVLTYCALIPVTYLLFLKAHSTGSSWGALWFLALAPILMIAGSVMRREKEAGLAKAAFAGAALVAGGSILLAFTTNHANLAGVPCATLLGIGALAVIARKVLDRVEFTVAANIVLTAAAFYALRAVMGTPAWVSQTNVWEMPYMVAMGLITLVVGGWLKVEPLTAPRQNQSIVAWHGWTVAVVAAGLALLNLVGNGAYVRGGFSGNTDRLDALIISIALLAPLFLVAQRKLELLSGRAWAAAFAGLAYVMQVWKEQPAAWEWYTMPLALFLFVFAWEIARNEKSVSGSEINGVLGLASALALLPSFIQGMPWNPSDLLHVLMLAIVGFAMIFTSLATRRKVPLLSASGAILTCLLVHAIHLAMHRQMLLPVGGLIAGFAVLAVASLFESRMNANVRTAVDRARAEARMFWTSWN